MTTSKLQKILIKFVKDQFKNNVLEEKIINLRVQSEDRIGSEEAFSIVGRVYSPLFKKSETKTFFYCNPKSETSDEYSDEQIIYLQSQGMGGFLWDNDQYKMIEEPLNEVLKEHKFLSETINGDACWEVNHI